MKSRSAFALAAFLFLGIGGTGAKADPILTPLIASAASGTFLAGSIAGVSYASIASHALKAPK
ncbi:hypothetical protein MKK58_00335 [Methylobacterium sp. J-078]|uniref:hypothetical protein n=1 Tax=Methylobacterium sp. J-078 TaxID=2836657 RepID=UPI001FB875BF|nr:hypothetical protein [Methylobacterium sp. J-078]MCJ2043007.1 hypothetical protein [Methylobacterium sp. J-078]